MLKYVDAHIHLEQYGMSDIESFLAGKSGVRGQSEVSHLAMDSMDLEQHKQRTVEDITRRHVHVDGDGDAGMSEVSHLVAVSMNLASCQRTEQLAQRWPGTVLPAYGYHPEQPLLADEELEKLLAWMDERKDQMIAIGEVGLPYYMRQEAEERGESFNRDAYVRMLIPFVKRAACWNKPIVLHAVYDDAAVVCDLLEQYEVKRAHFHWFKGDEQTVARMAANGYYISFTPDIVYESEIQELARRYSRELVMTETDGPWPFEGPFSGRATEPSMVRDVASAYAALHGMEPAEAVQQLYANAQRLYMGGAG